MQTAKGTPTCGAMSARIDSPKNVSPVPVSSRNDGNSPLPPIGSGSIDSASVLLIVTMALVSTALSAFTVSILPRDARRIRLLGGDAIRDHLRERCWLFPNLALRSVRIPYE